MKVSQRMDRYRIYRYLPPNKFWGGSSKKGRGISNKVPTFTVSLAPIILSLKKINENFAKNKVAEIRVSDEAKFFWFPPIIG